MVSSVEERYLQSGPWRRSSRQEENPAGALQPGEGGGEEGGGGGEGEGLFQEEGVISWLT